VDDARFEPRETFEALRPDRGFEAAAHGLWCLGTLESLRRPCVALVGTRAATPYGRRLARTIAADLGRAGCTILSGLALGIDAAAHEGALDGGAPTVGVLGGGHRQFFPPRNAALAERMIALGGAVLSPYPPETIAQPWQFLARNGIVAALADAVVVIEAPARSGALNTAGWAAGRVPVLAVPGDVERTHVQGCLALIRDGALLARHAGDVLEALGIPAERAAPEVPLEGDEPAAMLMQALDAGECDLDALVAATGLSAADALAALARLELDGRAERRDGMRYARTR
jgi:DNA processing protein